MNSKEKIISKFVEFKSKMNLLIALVGEEIKKAKGVNKNVVKIGDIKYFFEVLFNKKVMRHKIKKFNEINRTDNFNKINKIKSSQANKVNEANKKVVPIIVFISAVYILRGESQKFLF